MEKLLKCMGRVGAGLENIDLDMKAEKQGVPAYPENRNAVCLRNVTFQHNKLNKADSEVRKVFGTVKGNRGMNSMAYH
jgi:hypothetical protein